VQTVAVVSIDDHCDAAAATREVDGRTLATRTKTLLMSEWS